MKYGYGTSSVKVRQGRKVGRWKNTRIERLHDAPPLMLIISNTHQNVFNLRFHFESYRVYQHPSSTLTGTKIIKGMGNGICCSLGFVTSDFRDELVKVVL